MSRAIFVIGKNRSGTKWLTNTVASHDKVCCVQRPEANGVVETNLLTVMPRLFGSLNDPDNRIGFIECFSETNFFKITGLEKSFLYNLEANNYYEVFDKIMNECSRLRERELWAHKFSPHVLRDLLQNFPEAKFILIHRNYIDNIVSSIALAEAQESKKSKSIERHILSYIQQDKIMKNYEGRSNVMNVQFEDFKRRKKKICRKISEFINIEFSKKMVPDSYSKNTSFRSSIDRDEVVSSINISKLKIEYSLFNTIPLTVLNKAQKIKNLFMEEISDKVFVPKTFSIKANEVGGGTSNRR